MAASKPVIHGRDHLPGGADPVPLLPGFATYRDLIKANPALWAYWPLSDPSGLDFEEIVAGRNMIGVEGTGTEPPPQTFSYGLAGPIVDDPSTSIEFVGMDSAVITTLGTSASYHFAGGDNVDAVIGGSNTCTIEIWFYPNVPAVRNSANEVNFNGYLWCVGDASTIQLSLHLNDAGDLLMQRSSGSVASGVAPTVAGWNHAAVTYDGTTAVLYLNGAVAGTLTAGPVTVVGNSFRLGRDTIGGAYSDYFEGRLAHVAIYTEALDANTIAAHAAGAGVVAPGDVLTTDGSGGTSWQPPTVEVTGGGINPTAPDETPAESGSSYAGTPATPSGWHLQAHYETVILHDSTRGRFDVPTMKWTRVPFNAIRISRTWEPTVNSSTVKTALLPDDRGLSGPARDGILHVNADMVWSSPQTVGGWYSIEYPVLDAQYLPDDDPEVGLGPRPEHPRPGDPIAAPDTYMRAARMMNVSQGYVLRMEPGSDSRAIFGWGFWDTADGLGDSPFSNLVDNPFPTYPIWAARPLHMLPPYPQMSPTDSRTYYVNYQGDPGFRFDALEVHTDLSAGANLCLQAWQDSPWLIRFSTDRFPAYHGYTGSYRGYPYLAITFAYDPDTINHSTGKLLLPAPA